MKLFPRSAVWPTILLLCGSGGLASAQGAAYPKIEASFNLNGLASDPFDYTVSDVRVQIVQPDTSVVSLPAFYDGGTTWRVRHTPMAAGLYQVSGVTLNGQPLSVSNLSPSSWQVGGFPTSPGFVRVDPANPRRFLTDDGHRYFPVGHNVAWWTNNVNLPVAFYKMGAAHENWSRVWMMHFYDSLNLEWPKVGAFGQFNLSVAHKWDAIVSAADQNGIHFQMTLQHHGQYSSSVDPNWPQNPYNIANGGFLTNAVDFFTDPTARALTKRKYRYIIARWGYSPAILAWELFNEVQYTDAGLSGQWAIIGAWHDEMAQFIRSQDPYHHLITTSSALDQPIWNQTDYYQHHEYPSDLITGLRDAQDIGPSQPVAPDFSGECGIDYTPHVGVSPPLWAGLMSAQSGGAMPWYWDTIDANNDYSLFRAVSDFVTVSGLGNQQALAKSSPAVSGGTLSPLVFAPGGDWGTASQDIFTVTTGAPDGIGSAPSYLQGDYHRSMTPNGYTFLVNYPQNGVFSVRILTIAASGAGFQIFVDGTVQADYSFPAAGSDVSTNLTVSTAVTAGPHTILLYNPGLDWVKLGNITLNPYVSQLAAYAVGNSAFNATWVWNRSTVYQANPGSPITGTVSVAGLNPGTYSATWWDTFAGTATTNFTFTVAGASPVTLNTPAVLRSAALFVGLPPHAGVTAPAWTQSAGSNAPAFYLPLTITNSGGLPLSYSLSITGASPVMYRAADSSQPGGPVFAWHDISGVGQDISSSFTALAAPKTAVDEGIAGPIDIGFAFPFFSGSQAPALFSQLYVSPNGFVAFNPFAGDTSVNTAFPDGAAPSNCVACFWDDLDLGTTGRVYTFADLLNGTFTVQFQNVRFKGTASTVSCQLILKTTGEILMQYKSMTISNACTVGVQNAARNQGLTVACNQNYLQPGFAVRLTPTPWFSLGANAGFVRGGGADTIYARFDPAEMVYGTYTATLLLRTGDAAQPMYSWPVSLQVISGIAAWRLAHFGTTDNSGPAADTADPDHDGLINILEYAFNLDPNVPSANPILVGQAGDHLTLSYQRTHPAPADITYLPEVSDDLTTGAWNSGPAFTSQSVVDNGDGTETVTVTDQSPMSSTPAHYLRIRIVP